MKRFWLVLLSLGLIVAFSSTAMAVEVKLSGEFYAGGMYLDKTNFTKTTTGGNPSTAFYYQRLRARTDFTVTPGLKLITRLDAMERAWGATRSNPGTALAADSAGTTAENENIAIDWVYIDYKSAIGTFLVGYMNYGSTGTIFGNSSAPQARIRFNRMFGPINVWASISKVKENSKTAINPVPPATAAFADSDNDVYHLEGIYNWENGRAGLNINYYNYANTRPPAVPAANGSYRRTYFLFTPYLMAKFGPVSVQAEFNYLNGTDKYEDGVVKVAGVDKVTLENISAYLDATANFGMFYAGGSIAYVSGDDPGSNDKTEGGLINSGRDWNPCLLMFSYYDRAKWAGNLTGYGTSSDTGLMANAWFFQFRGGVKPTEKLDVMASVSYANADKKPATYLYNDYGWEMDLTATYKITNNLSYMVGAGYWFTGKYYKANLVANNELNDDFLVINKLTLTF
ncbi:MAG TPA: hypothetical protein P5208_00380 [Smithellaceae bacterium]|mgnify:FL=1|nr:hypothetical protein [Smithellaceae bacterium]